ncbi:hypothetical protein AXE80_03575 [Wenyingzhuangia fucanilytica]|uniref:CBM6 domain-containing protein n=1 Tax=Wenyingzhuangia fucanilytica TaxID=1790137 RepID=A0A1B1Y3R7_9FLAO|nr:carbohydrate-binding protein [Wenyingzhuangia fucanilytica]ANW95414.1 hypothetical protein AXE80_03575 [Wenyingzhuangia fucanilytica]
MKNNSINVLKIAICSIAMFVYSVSLVAQSIVVNSTNYKQTIDMIGGDMERSSSAIQSAKNKEEIIQWGFGDINFNVCRVQYDKNQEITEGVKNWSFYDKQVTTMQAIKAVNPDIKFFATMRSDYDGYGDDNNMPDWIHTYSSKVTDVEKYGVFLADYCEYMSNQGVPIDILSTAKEWMWHVRASEADDIINTLNSELDERGIVKPVIIDQGFWSLAAGNTYLRDVASLGTKDLYTGFCSHNYANEDPDQWVAITERANALGKPMYDDETSTGSGSPTYGVEREMFKQIDEYIKKAERYKAGLNGEVYFEIWSRGIDKETRSIYFPAKGTGTRLRGYYMMKQFSNNILGYTYVTSSVNDLSKVYTITFRKDDKIVLWVINESTSEYTMPITMDQSTITSEVATHYWTNNTPIEGSITSYTASGNTFTPTLEGESMNCYIFDVTEETVEFCNHSSATDIIEAECYHDMSGIEKEDNTEGTESITGINDGDWIKFDAIDFGEGVDSLKARVASNTTGGSIEIRTESVSGTLIGTLPVNTTFGLQNWETLSVEIDPIAGVKDVYFVFKGGAGDLFNINWFQFLTPMPSVDLEGNTANGSVSLSWDLNHLELATQNLYRNILLSETGKILVAENIATNTYADHEVNNGETYYYWVEATTNDSSVIKSNIVTVTPSIPNLALATNGSVATQSSTAYSGPPELAIDGNTDGNYGGGSVTHTEHGENGSNTLKWWQVDLGANYIIENINIYNRTGSNYGERLNNFTVEVIDDKGNITFTQFYADYPNPSQTIEVGGVTGSMVKISKTSDYGITLAEVEVYGSNLLSMGNRDFNKINVYPNPVSNNVIITNSQNSTVEFYTVLGKLVFTDVAKSNEESYDISDFGKGIYFVKINQHGVSSTKKIIKK